MSRSLVPALAVTASALLVAAVVTALAWQDIVDEFDQSVADQLALLSRAKSKGLMDCYGDAIRLIHSVSEGQKPMSALANTGLPYGAALYRETNSSQRVLVASLTVKPPPPAFATRHLSGPVTLIEDPAEPWLLVAYAADKQPGPRWVVAEPLAGLVFHDMLRQYRFATTSLAVGGESVSNSRYEHGSKARLVGVDGVTLDGLTIRVTVATERVAAIAPALGRFMHFCLAMAIPLLACICLLGIIAGRAVLASVTDHRRAAERQALHEISEALLSAPTLREVLQCIVDRARGMFGAAGASLALVDPSTGDLVFEVASAADQPAAQRLAGRRMATAAGLTGWTVANQEAVLRNGGDGEQPPAPSLDEALGGDRGSAMAAPLLDDQKRCFGAVCLVSATGRPFGEADLVLLRSLATTAAVATARAAAAEREREQARVANELYIARTVQQSLLPAGVLTCGGFDLAGATEPAHEVGGDCYDFNALDDGSVSFIIADVADKGLGAAMFMVVCRSLYYACGAGRRPPAETLADLNDRLVAMNSSNLFVTVFHGVLDPLSGRVDYACAGHLPPVLWRAATGSATFVAERGMALGVVEQAPIGAGSLVLEPGDALVLYTDGITDALDAGEQAFGIDRLVAAVSEAPHTGATAVAEAVMARVAHHVGTTAQFDDTTLLVLCRPAVADQPS